MKVIGLGVNNRIGQSGSNFGKFKTGTLTAPVASGTLPSQSLQQGVGVVAYTSSGAFTGPVSSWSMTGGAAGISINTSTGVISVDRAVVAVSTYSLSVTATNAAGSSSPVGFSLNVFSASASTIGFRATLDSGTTGDIYVAKTGNDSNPGTFALPKLTIGGSNGAIFAATTGQEIKVRAGTYREQFDLSPKQLILSRYGTERVIVSGGEPLTGGVACTIADLPDVGANWASIYKFTVTTTSIASGDGRAALVSEGETPLAYAMAWAVDPRFPNLSDATSQFVIADSVTTAPNPAPTAGREDFIMGYTYPALTDLYTQTQLQRGYVHTHGYPNVNGQFPVTSYNTTTKLLSLDGSSGEKAYYAAATDPYQKAFAIGNVLPAMKRGSWGFITSGATTVIYVWPFSTGSIASGMQYASRVTGITLGTNTEVRGIEATMVASTADNFQPGYAIEAGGTTKKSNLRIKNCRVFNTWRNAFNAYGGIWIGNTDDFLMEDVTIDNAYGAFGFFLQGNGDGGQRARIRRVLINGSAKSPARLFNQFNAFVSNLYVVDPSGLAAHANKTNFYQYNDKVMYHNCFLGGASGYLTWQETSRIAVVGCFVPSNYKGDDFRAIEDQNGTAPTPASALGQSGASYILRNTTVPFFVNPNATESLGLGNSARPEVTFTVAANVLGGVVLGAGAPPLDRAAGNYFTTGSVLDASDTLSTNTATYTDHITGDVSYKATAPIRSVATTNISAEIAVIKSWFPDISNAEFDKDIYGNTVDWAAVKPGVSNDYDANFGLAPILIEKPSVTGAPILGGTMGTTPYFIIANPFPTITAKWQNSTDGVTWTDISGATGATYVPVAGDVGKFVARLFTGSGISFRTQSATPVASSYPLSDPASMVVKTQAGVGSPITMQDETASYTSTGKPLMVVVSQRAGTAADSTVTVTVGTPGRGYGTGTSLTQQAFQRRTQSQSHVFLLLAPSAGTVSVQVQGSLTANSWRIQAYEVGGLTSIGSPSYVGGSNVTTLTSNLTTTIGNSGAFFVATRVDGDTAANPLSVTGSDPLVTATTGGVSTSNDLAIGTVYGRAPSAGTITKTFSYPTSRNISIIGLELKS
jgi:hypothetical protein